MKPSTLLLMPAIALLLTACGSAPRERMYSMSAAQGVAPAAPQAAITRRVVIGPVSVPEAVNRVEIVVRRGEHRLELLEFERWAALPPSEIALATAQALEAALADAGTRVAVDAPSIGPPATLRVVIDVQRFDAVLGQSLGFEATWRVIDARGALQASGQTRALEPAPGGAEGLAAAAGRATAQLARQVAAAMAAAPTRP